MAADVMLTGQFIVIGPLPKVVVEAPVIVRLPFCTVPVVNAAVVPLMLREKPPKSRVPLVMEKLLILEVDVSKQMLPPVTIVTLSIDEGIPLGVQFVGLFQAEEVLPFQVYEVWGFAVCINMNRPAKSKICFIGYVVIVKAITFRNLLTMIYPSTTTSTPISI